MTYREYAEKHFPQRVNHNAIGGVYGCPGEMDGLGLTAPIACGPGCAREAHVKQDRICTACWDQEMPGTKKPAPRKGLSGKIVYIAGPITGVEKYWEAFEAAEEELRGKGYITLLPSRLPEGMTNAQYMRICLAMIDVADWVYFLPGSMKSRGARLELDYCLYTEKPYRLHEGGGEE